MGLKSPLLAMAMNCPTKPEKFYCEFIALIALDLTLSVGDVIEVFSLLNEKLKEQRILFFIDKLAAFFIVHAR